MEMCTTYLGPVLNELVAIAVGELLQEVAQHLLCRYKGGLTFLLTETEKSLTCFFLCGNVLQDQVCEAI